MQDYLQNLTSKKPLETGHIAMVIEGIYAHQGLIIKELRPNGVIIATDHDQNEVQFNESELWHGDDYTAANLYASRRIHEELTMN